MSRTPTLSAFNQSLRPYQAEMVSHALAFGDRRVLYCLPTGAGKGTAELALLQQIPEAWVISPSLEVLRGFIERCGGPPAWEPRSSDSVAEEAAAIRVSTPVRLFNQVARGDRLPPGVLIIDEAHHATEDSGPITALAASSTRLIGFTATPFRGSPRETVALYDFWDRNVYSPLTFRQAVEIGAVALPEFITVPLLEDSVLSQGTEFDTSEADDLAVAFIQQLADVVRRYSGRPTLVVVPGLGSARALTEALGGFAFHISADTSATDRAGAYSAAETGAAPLVTVGVGVEGVDLPWLKVLVDARPTMSPVRWTQTLGRITRPGGDRPVYVGVTHNLERHSYILEGLIPTGSVTEAQTVWGPMPSLEAFASRAGIEVMKRFKPMAIPLLTGATAACYALWTHNEAGQVTEYAVLVSPYFEAFAATRPARGTWAPAPVASVGEGWRSTKYRTTPATEKQQRWWTNVGGFYGLEPTAEVTGAQMTALSVCATLRRKLVP